MLEMGLTNPQNQKVVKLFSSISRSKLDGFYLAIRVCKGLFEPVKISYCDKKSIDICKSYEVKLVRNMVRNIFQAALNEFEFLNTYKTQLKSLEDITDNSHMENISLILIFLR